MKGLQLDQKPMKRSGSMKRTKVVYDETPIEQSKRRSKPADNPESREKQLIALAYNLVEKRLREGTATSQETTHFLRLGSLNARLEQDILKNKAKKMEAEIKHIQSQDRVEELYANALAAMRSYSINNDDED